ncbi:methyltransferase domain-containing protein [Paraconexibacter sp.]|uniref:methyltransferase domain-containing protein n=1 Tax=Paraconexibacter sp. TaxID=2949640 RepID=UPI00356A2F93
MLASAAARIDGLPQDHLILDVGGWAAPMSRADWVIDLLPYETRGLYVHRPDPAQERFGADTWVQRDICGAAPWPFADKQFDFAVCSHTLEDVRDPLRVCEELCRVAKAGYVEVPAPIQELTFGLHGPWVGWSHHHWITELEGEGLRFTMKPHLLVEEGRHLPEGSTEGLTPEELVLQLWWEEGFAFREQAVLGVEEFDAWLFGLVEECRARAAPVGTPDGRWSRLRRRVRG